MKRGDERMSIVELVILLVLLLLLCLWIVSEVILFKSVKKKKASYIWLAINILLPIIGFVIYRLIYGIK